MKKNLFLSLFLWPALFIFPPAAQSQTVNLDELSHRPRLAFDSRRPRHIKRVIKRIHSGQKPWADGYRSLLRRVQKGKVLYHHHWKWKEKKDSYRHLYGRETQNGIITASRAGLAWLYSQGTRPRWLALPRLKGEKSSVSWIEKEAEKAAEALAEMYDKWPAYRGPQVILRGITAAGSLYFHCLAYDFLLALPDSLRPPSGLLERGRKKIENLAADFYQWFWTVNIGGNNHPIRVVSALGVAALTLGKSSRYKAFDPTTWKYHCQSWLKLALYKLNPTGQNSLLARQIRSGAYAEGTHYYRYAAELYLPFYFAHSLLSKGKTSLLQHRAIQKVALWPIRTRLPDGRRAIVDNSRYHRDWTSAYFLSRPKGKKSKTKNRAIFYWDWKTNGYYGATGSFALTLMAAFDPSSQLNNKVAQMKGPPWSPNQIQPRAGTAALRTGWQKDDSWVLVTGEKGNARLWGLGHDSSDNGAFQFYARGDLITLDPGYGGWSKVTLTNKAHHRSMVLIGRKGPPSPDYFNLNFLAGFSRSTNAFLAKEKTKKRKKQFPKISHTRVFTRYRGYALWRQFLLVERDLLVIRDRVKVKKGETRQPVAVQIQTNGKKVKERRTKGGSSFAYFTLKKKVPVRVAVLSNRPLQRGTTLNYHAIGEGTHRHLQIRWETKNAPAQARFLTFIALGKSQSPQIRHLATPRGVQAVEIKSAGGTYLIISKEGRNKVTIRGSKTFGPQSPSATFLILKKMGNKGRTLFREK